MKIKKHVIFCKLCLYLELNAFLYPVAYFYVIQTNHFTSGVTVEEGLYAYLVWPLLTVVIVWLRCYIQ
jgi:hypothetical protein